MVLVNGRRHVGGAAGSPAVDVSMIPTALIDRVEVVTGGASAVYGSEAVAGVVNFILKDDVEGITLDIKAGTTDEGGADDFDISLVGGRGHAVLFGGYSDRGELKLVEREISKADISNSLYGSNGAFYIPSAPAYTTVDDATGLWNKNATSAQDGFNR